QISGSLSNPLAPKVAVPDPVTPVRSPSEQAKSTLLVASAVQASAPFPGLVFPQRMLVCKVAHPPVAAYTPPPAVAARLPLTVHPLKVGCEALSTSTPPPELLARFPEITHS